MCISHARCLGILELILGLLIFGGCTDHGKSPVEPSDALNRHLQLAFLGESAIKVLINGQPLTDPNLAARLRVDMVVDAGRPTFKGEQQQQDG